MHRCTGDRHNRNAKTLLFLDVPRTRPIVREGPRSRPPEGRRWETTMEINISLLKDLGAALGDMGDAIGKIADGIKHAVVTGVEGYDAVKERRSQARLFGVISGSVDQSHLNIVATSEARAYISLKPLNDAERSDDWTAVLEKVGKALANVSALTDDLGKERSDFVLEPAYVQLKMTLAARERLLDELRRMSPPASAEELDVLNDAVARYDVLVHELDRARDGLNAYLKSRKA